jgi:hypothetical protein
MSNAKRERSAANAPKPWAVSKHSWKKEGHWSNLENTF